ncbi:integrase [Oxalobacteraceae bacterium GrIS 2.11]
MNRPRKFIRDPFGNVLLPRMAYHHGAYCLRTPDGKRVHLGREFSQAVQKYAMKVAPAGSDSMYYLIEAWRRDRLPAYADTTRVDTSRRLDVINKTFSDYVVGQLTPADVYAFCNQWADKPRSANIYRGLLSLLFTYGASTAWPNNNPARQSLTFKEGAKRDRYLTDDEVLRIKAGALKAKDGLDNRSGPMLCAFIDLALMTAQRVGDLLALEWKDWLDDGIFFHPAKTVNSTGVKMLIESSPPLKVLRARIAEMCEHTRPYDTVIQTLDGKPYTYSGMQTQWRRARERAGVTNAHIHDLRAKALTDMGSASEAQALAGHATESMTAHYRKARSTTIVKGAR